MPTNIDNLSDEELLSQFGGSNNNDMAHPVDKISDDDLVKSFIAPSQEPQIQQTPSRADYIKRGLESAVLDVGGAGVKGTNYLVNKFTGSPSETLSNLQQDIQDIGARNQKLYGDSAWYQAPKIGEEIGITAPIISAGGSALGALGGLAESIPGIARIGEIAQNAAEGNKLLSFLGKTGAIAATGAAQGAAGNALTSGTSTQSVSDLALQGAEYGVPLGLTSALIGKTLGKIGSAIAPYTERGQQSIINNILTKFGGKEISPESIRAGATEIVPGSAPTLAEVAKNPGISQLQDTLRDINSAPYVERAAQNAQARLDALQAAKGSAEDIESAISERNDIANTQRSNIFKNASPVSPQPVVDTIDSILNGTGGKRDAVINSLNNIRSKLVDSNGNLETNPETLYDSVRKQIGDLLDKSNLTNPAGRQASSELIAVRDSLDNVIDKGASGFKNYLDQYSAASKPIDSMQWLQNLNLTDSQGNITLPKIQNAIKNVNKLQSASGINQAKAVTQDQINTLQSIRDDLLRQQNLTLGKSFGSPTVQKGGARSALGEEVPGVNGFFNNKLNPQAVGAGAGAAIGNAVGAPGAGAMLGGFLGKKVGQGYSAQGQVILNKLHDIMLHPENYPGQVPPGLLDNSLIQALRNNAVPAALIAGNSLNNR